MSGKLILYFLSVGNGHCTYIVFPNGQNALVDVNFDKDSPLSILSAFKATRLNHLIITHPHRDHITGLTELINKIPSDSFIFTPVSFQPDDIYEDWNTYEQLKRTTSPHRTIFGHNIGGLVFNGIRYGGVNVSYYRPNFGFFPSQDINFNNHSLIVSLVYGKNKIILCGDTEEDGWDKVPDYKLKNTTLLLASHHGNDSGYCSKKISTMSPQYVVISAGPKTEADADDRYRYHTNKWNSPYITALGGQPPKRVFSTRTSGVLAVFNNQTLESIENI